MSVTDIPQRELEADIETHPLMLSFGEAMTNGRAQRIIGVYKLWQLLRTKPPFLHEQILTVASQRFAGGAIEGLREDLRWVEKVELDDLLHVFDDHGIDTADVFRFLTLTHFRTVARVRVTSRERCELLVHAHHENLFTNNFEQWLIEEGHLKAPVPRGSVKRKVEKGKTHASDLLLRIASHLREIGRDLDLSVDVERQGDKPINAAKFLQFLASKYPDVEFRL